MTTATSEGRTAPTTGRRTVAVCPPAALAGRPRLFGALGDALDLSFEGRTGDALDGVDAALLFGAAKSAAAGPPRLVLGDSGVRAGPGAITVGFADSGLLDERLRGARLREQDPPAPAPVGGDGEVLAAAGRTPLWTAGPDGETAALAPPELGPGEPLRELLRPGRFAALVPVIHFLRRAVEGVGWRPPPLRACFLFDDPNLVRPSYGYVDYRELAAWASAGGYHAAMAMVPADGRLVHREAARIFSANADALSLVMHGNDHVRRELEAPRSSEATDALLAQALRRIAAFERRSGVAVGRIMVPPHGACSRRTLERMPRFDFEALCLSRPHPWLDAAPPDEPLAGWAPADRVAGGMPVIPRIPLARAEEEVVVRAFLDHPLIVYGHHADLRDGLGVLERVASRIDALGSVTWRSPVEIARSNWSSRREGAVLAVRPFARRLTVELPTGVEAVRVDPGDGREGRRVDARDGGTVEVILDSPDRVDPDRVPPPPQAVWPLARRALTQVRDRMMPVIDRATARGR